jgi:hypothetical protein
MIADHGPPSERWRVRRAPMLLSIAQRRDWRMERLDKFRLRHVEALALDLAARNPAQLRQLLRGERLRVRIGQSDGRIVIRRYESIAKMALRFAAKLSADHDLSYRR